MSRSFRSFQTTKVLTLSGGHFTHDLYSAFLPPLLPLLVENLSLSMTLAGLLTVVFRVPSLVNPFMGLYTDRFNLRPLFVLCPLVTACCMVLLGAASSYFWLCCLMFLAGVSSAVLHVSGPVLVTCVAGDKLGRGMSMWMMAGEIARSLGPLLCVGGIALFGLQSLWPLSLLALLATFLLCRFSAGMTTLSEAREKSWRAAWQSLRPVVAPLAGLLLARAFILNGLSNYLPVYMVGQGSTIFMGGAALTVLELAGTAGTFLGGSSSDRLGRKPVLLFSLAVSPFLLLLFVFSSGMARVLLLVLLGLITFACSPVLLALTQEFSGGHRGAANGIYMGLNFVITALVLLFMGWLADRVGFQTTFLVSAGLAFLAMPCAFALPWKKLA